MKTKTLKIYVKEKELLVKIVMLSTLSIMAYSKLSKNTIPKSQAIELSNIYRDNFGDFDKVQVPNKAPVIAQMVSALRPELQPEQSMDVADKISWALKKYKVEPQIVVAIIDTESNFNNDAVSSTGDLSMAQVNVEIWNKEFVRIKQPPIDIERIKSDKAYSVEVMAKILSLLKKRHAKHDRRWYARYHSKTSKHKRVYLTKLEKRMKLLEKAYVQNKIPMQTNAMVAAN